MLFPEGLENTPLYHTGLKGQNKGRLVRVGESGQKWAKMGKSGHFRTKYLLEDSFMAATAAVVIFPLYLSSFP